MQGQTIKMRHRYYLVILSLAILAWFHLASGLSVSTTDAYCELKGEVLFCDYKDANQATVSMKELGEVELKKVCLHNINVLSMTDSICVNIILLNVKQVKVGEESRNACNKDTELSAMKSNLDKIPRSIKGLYLEESNLESLETDSAFSKLNIISSTINKFNMTKSLMKGTKAIIQDTKIIYLQKVVVGPDASLLVQKSSINMVNEKSMEIIDGQVTVKDSTITVGDLTVSGQCPSEISAESGQQYETFLALFVVCLLLLLASWIFMAVIHKEYILNCLHTKTKKQTSTNIEAIDNEKNVRLTEEGSVLKDKNKEVSIKNAVSFIKNDKNKEGIPSIEDKSVQISLLAASSTSPDKSDEDEIGQLKSSYAVRKKNFDTESSDLITEISKLEQGHTEKKVKLYFDRINCSCKFLDFLQGNHEKMIKLLAEPKIAEGMNVYYLSECNSNSFEQMFKNHEEVLEKHLNLLTKDCEKEVMTTDMVKCFKVLRDFFKKDKKVPSHFSQKIKENSQQFKEKIQGFLDENVIKNVHNINSENIYKICAQIFKENEKDLKNILNLITVAYEHSEYKEQFKMNKETAKSFEELSKSLNKDGSRKKNALSYLSQKIVENSRSLEQEIQEYFQKDITNNVHRLDKTLNELFNTPENKDSSENKSQ